MTHSKIFAALVLLALPTTAAQAQTWTNSAAYNGYASSSQNTPSAYSLRDQNGNLTMVNGQVTSAQFGSQSGAQYANAGVGTGGAGTAYGEATAIGNSLNVQVIGTHNTTIIDSSQINNGNQTATANVNSH